MDRREKREGGREEEMKRRENLAPHCHFKKSAPMMHSRCSEMKYPP